MRILQTGLINRQRGDLVGPVSQNNRFEVVERRQGDIQIVLYLAGKPVSTFPDFMVSSDEDYSRPDDVYPMPHQVFMSLDNRAFFVHKHMESLLDYCHFYRRRGNTLEQRLVRGQRFDEACVRYACLQQKRPASEVTYLERETFLIRWATPIHAVFDVASSSVRYDPRSPRKSLFARVVFDVSREMFVSAAPIKPFR